jgi:hypothetical protein
MVAGSPVPIPQEQMGTDQFRIQEPFDICFNDAGDLFAYDSDMEWILACHGTAHPYLPCSQRR